MAPSISEAEIMLGLDRGAAEVVPRRRFHRPSIGLLVPIVFVLVAVVTSLFASFLPVPDPNSGDLASSLVAPGSPGHPLGTDLVGRDILSRVIYGLQTTTIISVMATLVALVVGLSLGVLAGYVRAAEAVIMRIVDVQLAFPSLILAIAIIAALGGASGTNIVIVLAITGWVTYARVIRSAVLSIKKSLYVDAALSTGARHVLVIRAHVLPNVLPMCLAMGVAQFPMFMIQAASLDYLGLGVPASTPSLGVMVQEGQQTLFAAWWPAVIPAVAMAAMALAVTSIGETFTRRLDK